MMTIHLYDFTKIYQVGLKQQNSNYSIDAEKLIKDIQNLNCSACLWLDN